MTTARHSDDDDDEVHDRRPVFRGSRNYEGFGSSLGETLGDVAASVKLAAANLKEQISRSDAIDKIQNKLSDVGDTLKRTEVGAAVQKEFQKVAAATSKAVEERRLMAEREKQRSRSHSKMPPGCYCDMRGYACPLHKGNELWRSGHVYQQHIKHNVEKANGGSTSASPDGGGTTSDQGPRRNGEERSSAGNGQSGGSVSQSEVDEMMAQLVSMGFDPERVISVLSEHKSLQECCFCFFHN